MRLYVSTAQRRQYFSDQTHPTLSYFRVSLICPRVKTTRMSFYSHFSAVRLPIALHHLSSFLNPRSLVIAILAVLLALCIMYADTIKRICKERCTRRSADNCSLSDFILV